MTHLLVYCFEYFELMLLLDMWQNVCTNVSPSAKITPSQMEIAPKCTQSYLQGIIVYLSIPDIWSTKSTLTKETPKVRSDKRKPREEREQKEGKEKKKEEREKRGEREDTEEREEREVREEREER